MAPRPTLRGAGVAGLVLVIAAFLGVGLALGQDAGRTQIEPGAGFTLDGLVVGEWMVLAGDVEVEFDEPVEAMHDFVVTNTDEVPRHIDMDLTFERAGRTVTTVECRYAGELAAGASVAPECTTERALLPTDYDVVVATLIKRP